MISKFSRFVSMFVVIFVLNAKAVSSSNTTAPSTCEGVFATISLNEPAKTERFNLFRYYLDKFSEIKELDRSAPLAMSLRLLIMNTTLRTERRMIPLKNLREIHEVNRPTALEKLRERTQVLSTLPKGKQLTADVLSSYIPSKNPIRVVNLNDDQFVVFDGNGRLVALKQVFDETTPVEVELFYSESRLLKANLRKLLEVRAGLEKAN